MKRAERIHRLPYWRALMALWSVAGSLSGLRLVIKALRALGRLARFEDLFASEPERWPRLSVVVAACNEAASIEPALDTLLAQDYPDLEVVAVDDRSADATGHILDGLAARDTRLRVMHVRSLPPEWLGKVHALHQGSLRATGEWLLFTDADVHFRPGVLRRAVSLAEDRGLDHLALLPRVLAPTRLLDAVVKAFGLLFILATRAGEVGRDPQAYLGVGAFNLVRRSVLERSEGFDWLRMELADDMGLALLLKRAGARAAAALAERSVEVQWYPSLGAMFAGLEKNAFAVATGFSWIRLIRAVLAAWLVVSAPLAALLFPDARLRLLGLASMGGLGAGAAVAHVRYGQDWRTNLLVPAGFLLMSLMLLRSGIRCSLRGGVEWRGTVYPLARLAQGRRVGIGAPVAAVGADGLREGKARGRPGN